MSPGRVVLCGSGEFTPAMEGVDREILSGIGAKRPRVAIVPTAAGLEDTPKMWAEKGARHFSALGAEGVPVMVLDKDDAHETRWCDAVRSVDWIYFSGGHPGYLVETLEGTPFWAAVLERVRAGGVLAGSSAGAMMLGSQMILPLGMNERGMPTRIAMRSGLGLLPGVFVAPHFDAIPEDRWLAWLEQWPESHRMIGVDEDTALVQDGEEWTVGGKGRVIVFDSLHERRVHTSGARLDSLTVAP